MSGQILIRVADPSHVGEARRHASAEARRIGLDQTGQGQAALLATEMAGNLIKHAGGGSLVLGPVQQGSAAGLEFLCLDRGRGMPDVERCLRDGYSTAGTQGTGLGAIRRVAHAFDVHSVPGEGTVLWALLWGRPPLPPPLLTGAVCLPAPGEQVCGDGWACLGDADRSAIMVVDGLGHGPAAAAAALEALGVFHEQADRSPVEILAAAHRALRATRGAAAAVATIDHRQGQPRELRWAGVGNIAGQILSAQGRSSLVSFNGIVGHGTPRLHEFRHPFPAGATLVAHSDGLNAHWEQERYRALQQHHPAIFAGLLYRDHLRGRDDATVIVARTES